MRLSIVFIHILILLRCAALQRKLSEEKSNPENYFERFRRQLDLILSADHDNQHKTDITLEALANLWRSADSKTTVNGGVKVVHSKNTLDTDSTKLSARLDLNFEIRGK